MIFPLKRSQDWVMSYTDWVKFGDIWISIIRNKREVFCLFKNCEYVILMFLNGKKKMLSKLLKNAIQTNFKKCPSL